MVLTQDWVYYMFRGTSEPMLIGASLWAIDRHLEGRRGQAFVLGVAASLIRPEAWPFIGLYALWLWVAEFRRPAARRLVIVGLALLPVLWFVPPWVGSGQPFLAASHAKDYNGHLGSRPVARGAAPGPGPAGAAGADRGRGRRGHRAGGRSATGWCWRWPARSPAVGRSSSR